MCILICRAGPRPLIAANRDELYARPFSRPRAWVSPTTFWAPRDEEEGGTWIGVNARGLLAAITNRSLLTEEPGRASRGHLISGLLGHADLESGWAWLEGELRRAARNPCQVYAAQGADARLCRVGEQGAFASTTLEPGIHVLSNLHEPGEIDLGLDSDADLDTMRLLLADSSPRLPRGFAVCKRAGWRGTVASALIEPGESFLFAGGPPDEVEYEPVVGYPAPSCSGGLG